MHATRKDPEPCRMIYYLEKLEFVWNNTEMKYFNWEINCNYLVSCHICRFLLLSICIFFYLNLDRTDDEKNRRIQQVEKLQGRLMQLQDQFGQKCLPGSTSRSVVVDMETTGWGDDENEQVRVGVETQKNQPIEQIRASHADMIRGWLSRRNYLFS